jgi:hypothetical protein
MINDAVILSEAKNLGSVSANARLGIGSEMFRFAQHDNALMETPDHR